MKKAKVKKYGFGGLLSNLLNSEAVKSALSANAPSAPSPSTESSGVGLGTASRTTEPAAPVSAEEAAKWMRAMGQPDINTPIGAPGDKKAARDVARKMRRNRSAIDNSTVSDTFAGSPRTTESAGSVLSKLGLFGFKKGGSVKGYSVDGIAVRGKTRAKLK